MVLRKDFEIWYVPSHNHVVGCITKTLANSRFQFLCDKLGVVETPFRLKGKVKTIIM